MATVNDSTHTALRDLLLNTSGQVSLAERFRALFSLKALKDDRSVAIISEGFQDTSSLLKHELAYVLGQMGNLTALPVLERVLREETEDPMVRHEAAEAMGALGSASSLPVLEKFAAHREPAIAETCELAIGRIRHEQSRDATVAAKSSAYTSVDPAPAAADEGLSTAELGRQLMDTSLPLFERYRAMFALRNRGDDASVLALAQGLTDSSCLFRHEIGFVFGQMQHPASVPALTRALEDSTEAAMVRHECAEALGSIATPEVLPILKKFSQDEERVVRESCIVALDMYDYEQSGQFQYATVPTT
ncbi:deoxyhypusine hydroxylase [Tieghemiomyces parasiticus]|uniref:Deoxyhypusine hydroxylase n=1 Tax=Tieghemiomyces parasiticus TaxID=78921 RepID=A0A9W8DLZ1_9FUNG|nr:deoxyhypusine hydroxylase [Tieghemiomyces parasiticus]